MYKKLLVACDGSEHAFKALDVAAELVDKTEGTIILLHAVPSATMPEGLAQWAASEHVNEGSTWLYDQSIGQGIMDVARSRIKDGSCKNVEHTVCHGDPADEIVESAQASAVDAIVIGTRGLTRLKRLIVGSVAQKVLSHAPCTVIMVH